MKKLIYSMLALFCAAFAFTSCEDVPMPYDQPGEGGEDPVVVEPTGDGTAENPFNVAAALEYINNLGADVESDRDVYIKGKVVTVTEEYSTNFGNGTSTSPTTEPTRISSMSIVPCIWVTRSLPMAIPRFRKATTSSFVEELLITKAQHPRQPKISLSSTRSTARPLVVVDHLPQ